MQKFIRMDTMVSKDGSEMSIEEYSKAYYEGMPLKVYKNDLYQVNKITLGETMGLNMVWLSIKRIDKNPIHDWRDLQEIKNQLVGSGCEGIELYPAERRRVDTANQYHLFVCEDPTFIFPIGFTERLVTDENVAKEIGAKQRPFEKEVI